VHAIVEESQSAEPGTEARKIGDLFTSFMDTGRIADLGATPLADQLARVDRITDIPSFLRTVGELERDGVAGLVHLYIEPDPGNPQRYIPFFIQGGLSLPDESYYRLENFEATRTAYRAHVQKMLELAGVADAAASADRIFALETELATHHWDKREEPRRGRDVQPQDMGRGAVAHRRRSHPVARRGRTPRTRRHSPR
jgi:putative endopeptidase